MLTPRTDHHVIAGRGSVSRAHHHPLREGIEERLGLLEIRSVEALGEPAVDPSEQLAGFRAFALVLPQAAQARGGAQLEQLRLLAAGNLDRLQVPGLRLVRIG